MGALSIPGAGCLPSRGGRVLTDCGSRKPRKTGSSGTRGREPGRPCGGGLLPQETAVSSLGSKTLLNLAPSTSALAQHWGIGAEKATGKAGVGVPRAGRPLAAP